MPKVIAASEPSWTAPFTGLSARQFRKLITALRDDCPYPDLVSDDLPSGGTIVFAAGTHARPNVFLRGQWWTKAYLPART